MPLYSSKRVHRHLRSTINDGLNFWRPTVDPKLQTTQLKTLHMDIHIINMPDSSDFEHVSFVDADWAVKLNIKRSVSGNFVFLAGVPINCKCKLQHAVALSLTESELYAAKNVQCVRSTMSHLGFNLSTPTKIYEDNAATIAVSNNERATKRLRHVDLRHFTILYCIKNGDVTSKSTCASENPSDYLAKPLRSILYSHNSDTLLGKDNIRVVTFNCDLALLFPLFLQ